MLIPGTNDFFVPLFTPVDGFVLPPFVRTLLLPHVGTSSAQFCTTFAGAYAGWRVAPRNVLRTTIRSLHLPFVATVPLLVRVHAFLTPPLRYLALDYRVYRVEHITSPGVIRVCGLITLPIAVRSRFHCYLPLQFLTLPTYVTAVRWLPVLASTVGLIYIHLHCDCHLMTIIHSIDPLSILFPLF